MNIFYKKQKSKVIALLEKYEILIEKQTLKAQIKNPIFYP